MKKLFCMTSVLIAALTIGTPAMANETHADRAVTHGSQAASHASNSAAHAIAASGQAVSGAASVPFMASGVAGAVSAQVGEDLKDAASAPIGQPLPITDETITVGPTPDLAIQQTTTDQ
ncbi:MAG TPA: hypothetical protein DHV36_20070 [Desulfobacteraceae bacterium]|nr:hypothetical protein [Desulfobacteraceae bacterium]